MSRKLILAAATACTLALTAGAAFAQSSISQEDAATARRAAQEAKDKPLLDA